MSPRSAHPQSRFVAAMACSVALALSGCSRCAGSPAQDASTPAPQGRAGAGADAGSAAKPKMHATDLRSALILIHPEFRGAHIRSGYAALVRVLQWPHDEPLLEALAPSLKARGHTDIRGDAQQVTAQLRPMAFEARRDGKQVTLELKLPLDEETVGRILHSPSPMGTEHLGSLMPTLANADVTEELYVMELAYRAKPDRANFLVRSLMEDMQTLGWMPTRPLEGWDTPRLADGGVGHLPSQFDVTVQSPHTGGRLQMVRDRGEVKLRYEQPLQIRVGR